MCLSSPCSHYVLKRAEVRFRITGLGGELWEEASARFGHKWSLPDVETVRVGGDGAACVPGASFHLDVFHLRKRLTEALALSVDHYERVCDRLSVADLEGTMVALEVALRSTSGTRRKRVRALKGYLEENWCPASSN